MNDLIETDILVIGCGIAGGTAALKLAQAGLQVTLITRSFEPSDSNTAWAQGGIIFRGHDDSPQMLAEDIERAGAGFCQPNAVRILAEEGPNLVQEILIDQLKVAFDYHGDGVSLVKEGGHGLRRIVHAADATGDAIETAMLSALGAEPNVQLLTGHTGIDLITPDHHSSNRLRVYEPISCIGAYVLDRSTGAVKRVLARRTILATGGLGQIFLYTTNPLGARGDGLTMASRAGARTINCEFVQFHPTAFVKPGVPRFLITEAVRGEGGRLVHEDGTPFMHKYSPDRKDLAPRDIVSRGIYFEMLERGLPHVYLDLKSTITPERILEHFPNIHVQCLQHGIDITTDLVPVAPAAHYFCGGVWVDEYGQTTIGRLYAVGEVSCTGLHGANRLASTSLLEGLVWGKRAAEHIGRGVLSESRPNAEEIPAWKSTSTEQPDPALISQDMGTIQHLMWNYVGLVRDKPRLDRAMSELLHLETEIERFYRGSQVTDDLIGVRNAVRSSVLVAEAAWANKQSIGCHYRES